MPTALASLGAELRAQGWELALEVIDEGLRDDVIPSLVRLGRVAQLVPRRVAAPSLGAGAR